MLRKLLVALDGTELAESVLPWALFLAHEKRVSVTLARVARSTARNQVTATPGIETLHTEWEAARRYLEEVRTRLLHQGLEVEIAVGEGPPAQTLLDLADDIDASAIVLATRGPAGVADLPLGKVAEQIVQEATLPVLLVPAHDTQPVRGPSARRVLVPLDGSPLAELALDVVRDLVSVATNLLLVRVVEPIRQTLDTAEGHLPLEDVESTERAVADATAYLEAVRQSAGSDDLPIRATVLLGEPDRQILATAHTSGADLIVMVTHGVTGPAHWWLGSVAEDVVRHADIPVFLVSARALVARVGRAYRVADVMTREPISVRTDETLEVVLRRLLRCRISGAPVVDATGALVGVITEYDLLHWQTAASAEPAPRSLRTGHVVDAMSHLTVSVDESMQLASAVPILLKLPYRQLPVTRDGRLTGILARADVLKAVMEQQATAADVDEAAMLGGVGVV